MALKFRNEYRNTIWVSLLYGDGGCGPNPFRKGGWWAVEQGQTRILLNNDLRNLNRHAAFYAQEYRDSGGATWDGTGQMWYYIRNVAFSQCYDDDTGCNQRPNFVPIDFQTADNGHHFFESLVITLGPSPGQVRTIGWVQIDKP